MHLNLASAFKSLYSNGERQISTRTKDKKSSSNSHSEHYLFDGITDLWALSAAGKTQFTLF